MSEITYAILCLQMHASRHVQFKGKLTLFLQLNMYMFEFLLLCNTLLLCCFIKISILVVTLLLSLAVLMFNILEKLCDLRKCLRVSLKKIIYFIILADKTDIFFAFYV